MPYREPDIELLKADLFGRVELVHLSGGEGASTSKIVRRDTRCARWWTKPLARFLARREHRALQALQLVDLTGQRASHQADPTRQRLLAVPQSLKWEQGVLERSWQPGEAMQIAQPRDPQYFADAFRLLVQLHRCRVTHNDTAKEPNWIVQPDGSPALIDFQLASVHRSRGRRFRLQAREDLRHLLKHKRTYCPQALTEREKQILATPSAAARIWRATGKRVYLFITRRCLGWADREGAGDRSTSGNP